MPLLALILLLLAPLLDVVLAARWFFASPAAAGLYLAAAAAGGALLMKFARVGVGEAMRMLSAGDAPIGAIIGFMKLWIAGALLLFPGYISDALAAAALFLPAIKAPPRRANADIEPPLEARAEIVDENERRD